MRYKEILEAASSDAAANAAKEQQKRVKANQNMSDARRSQNDALRRLHDRQSRAAETNDPTKAADALRSYERARTSAANKMRNAQAALSKPKK